MATRELMPYKDLDALKAKIDDPVIRSWADTHPKREKIVAEKYGWKSVTKFRAR